MVLDTNSLIEGEKLHFQDTLDCSMLEFSGQIIFPMPVTLSGAVEKRAGIVTLEGRYETLMSLCCDRCGEDFEKPLSEPLRVVLASEREADDREDIVLLQNGTCDLHEVFRPAVILSVEPKILCSEDCRGICFRCGRNLNEEECRCPQKDIDPRLEALRAYLDPSEDTL